MRLEAFVPFVTYPEANADIGAASVVSFAGAIGASIHALAINADIPDVSNALSKLLLNTPEMIRDAEVASRRRGDHLLAAIKEKASVAGIEVAANAVAAPLALLGDVAATRARYFDLSLLSWEAGNQTSRMSAESVIFGSGRPAVLLPGKYAIDSIDHIAIAWDGSRVAARAVADARLILQGKPRVSVITVVDEKPLKERDAAERLSDALRRGGLNAEVASVKAEDCPIAETLQQSAIERGCKLLVMGGYGHSRIRDFVLGGATQGVLDDLLMPVMISH